MNPKIAINYLREAKLSHLEWLAYVQAFYTGLSHDQIRAPLSYKNCKFGQWFYNGHGKELSALQSYATIEVLHKLLHLAYSKFVTATLEGSLPDSPDFLASIEGLSSTLFSSIELMEDEIRQLSDEEFYRLIGKDD